jgi:hypothetical protein
VPPIYRQPPPTEPLMTEENVKKEDCPSPPMTMPNGKINNSSGNVDEIRAKALWDYQAEVVQKYNYSIELNEFYHFVLRIKPS